MKSELKYNGERYIPGVPDIKMEAEHWARYFFAGKYVHEARVLDIACGEGYGTHYLSTLCKEVVGVDIDVEAIKHASNKYSNSNLSFIQSSAELYKSKCLFDVVTCFETIEHLTEQQQNKFLKNLVRLLTTNGYLIISTPIKSVHAKYHVDDNPFHLKEFETSEFKQFLQKYFANFQLVFQYSSFSVIFNGKESIGDGEVLNCKSRNIGDSTFRPEYVIAICSNSPIEIDSSEDIYYFDENKYLNIQSNFTLVKSYWSQTRDFNQKSSEERWLPKNEDYSVNYVLDLTGKGDINYLRFLPSNKPCKIIFIEIKINNINVNITDFLDAHLAVSNCASKAGGEFYFYTMTPAFLFKNISQEYNNLSFKYISFDIGLEDALGELSKEYFRIKSKL